MNKEVIFIFIIIFACLLFVYCLNKDLVLHRKNGFKSLSVKKPVSDELANMPVYVINLANRTDRKNHMISLLKKLGFKNYTFVIPVNKEDAMKHPLMKNTQLTPSKASNTLTFFKIFQETPHDKFIIMEDDIDIYYDKVTMDDVYNSSKSVDWDLLYFEFCFADCKNIKKVDSALYKLEHAVCTGCTIFKKEAGLKLVKYFDETYRAKDQYFSFMNEIGHIKSYGFPLFRQSPIFGSDLEGSFKYYVKNMFAPICAFS